VKRYEKSFGSNGGECLAKDCVGGAQVYEMIELIHTRHSERDGHAMDVLMEALRKQRVQAHIARELQRALARAKDQRRGDGTPSPMSPQSNPPVVPTRKIILSHMFHSAVCCLAHRPAEFSGQCLHARINTDHSCYFYW
jgi:hypothetical protein